MAKNKDPAFMFYPADFMMGTFFMTNEEVGIYIRMLCMQHQQGRLSAEEMDSMCGNRSKLRAKFVMDEDGMYYNARLDDEITKRCEFKEKLKQSGAKGAKQRTHNNQATLKPPLSHPQATLKPPLSHPEARLKPGLSTRVENVNINTDINDKEDKKREFEVEEKITHLDERFNSFWSAYPKKVGKAYAKQCFDRLKPTAELTQKMLDAIKEQKESVEWRKDNGQYIPNPSTWLNQGRWEDELSPASDAESNAPTSESVIPKYSNFDAEEAFQRAVERTYGKKD